MMMPAWILSLLLAIATFSLHAQESPHDWCVRPTYCYASNPWDQSLDIAFDAGYRQDHLIWSQEGVGGSPNVAREQSWKHMRSFVLSGSFNYRFYDHLFLEGNGDYGRLFHGRMHDSSFSGDNESGELTSTYFHAKRGHVFDYSGACGYEWSVIEGEWLLSPIAGYSQHVQHFKGSHAEMVVGPTPGDLPNAKENYHTRWSGPWVGLNVKGFTFCNLRLYAEAQYHWAHFKAQGTDISNTLVETTYKQHARRAYGIIGKAGAFYVWDPCWTFGFHGEWNSWRTKKGIQRDYTTVVTDAGSTVTFVQTPLHHVHWHNISVVGSIVYHF